MVRTQLTWAAHLSGWSERLAGSLRSTQVGLRGPTSFFRDQIFPRHSIILIFSWCSPWLRPNSYLDQRENKFCAAYQNLGFAHNLQILLLTGPALNASAEGVVVD